MSRERIAAVRDNESGAALATTVLISFLLGTACIAMLTAVAASSRNNTDALSESKAYYAAESGIQATINTLRNTSGMTYSSALAQQTAGTFPVSGPITLDSETSYSVTISDPDHAQTSTTYTTGGFFAVTPSGPWTTTAYFPNSTDANRTELTFIPPTGAPITFNHPAASPFPQLGNFRITRVGTGGTMTTVVFKINYQMIDPRPGVRTIRGSIVVSGGNPSIHFDQFAYSLSGGAIGLCPTSACTTSGTAFADIAMSAAGGDTAVYAKIDPLDPYRLVITSTGRQGSNGAVKRLEAIVQKNFFNDSGSGPPLNLTGPNVNFDPGTSNQMAIQGGSAPSVGVCDSASLTTVTTAHTNGTLNPPPAMTCDENPSWLTSPIALDALVRQLRQSAQNTGRYFPSGGPSNSQGWGNFTNGTGLTFCEGDCTLGGNTDGGGILVVTGTLTTSGSPRFTGLVLVVGAGGILRNGGGSEVFTGNIVVAPYNPNALTSTFTMSPQYVQHGGSGDTINSTISVDDAVNGASAITNFVLGVAEK